MSEVRTIGKFPRELPPYPNTKIGEYEGLSKFSCYQVKEGVPAVIATGNRRVYMYTDSIYSQTALKYYKALREINKRYAFYGRIYVERQEFSAFLGYDIDNKGYFSTEKLNEILTKHGIDFINDIIKGSYSPSEIIMLNKLSTNNPTGSYDLFCVESINPKNVYWSCGKT